MAEGIVVSMVISFIKLMSPIAALLAIILFLRPKMFIDIEKKLSSEMGAKRLRRKSVGLLEKENMALQRLLIQYNRFVGFFIFVLSIVIIVRLYLHVSL